MCVLGSKKLTNDARMQERKTKELWPRREGKIEKEQARHGGHDGMRSNGRPNHFGFGSIEGEKDNQTGKCVCACVCVCVCVCARRKCTAGTDDTPSWKSPRVPGVTCGFSAGWAGAVAGSGRGRVPSGDGASHGRRAL